ncbi:MAG: SDR family oxidoreductase [Fusobacteriaceae bacterium]
MEQKREISVKDFGMDWFSLKGKNAIVTGGNGGLGTAFCMALAKAGANIFVPSIADDDGSCQKMIEEVGVKYEFLKIDITQNGNCKKVVDTCVSKFGSVDILINCAGICINEPDVTKFDREKWDKMISVNLTAAFEMGLECSKHMIPQKSGKIINIASLYSFLGGQWSPAYTATKCGIVGFTRAYCDELAQFGIQVNAIAPGYYATPLTAKTRSNPEINKRILDHIPANRWGWTADLMGATVFLASKASDYVNGTILTVDGGYLMR